MLNDATAITHNVTQCPFASLVTNIMEEDVLVPLLVHTSAVTLATECVRLILKIDDIVVTR